MKTKTLKIAIYSGKIPSTTFIERLIVGLSEQKHCIYLYGLLNFKPNYPNLVSIRGYNSKFSKLYTLVKYTFLLTVFKKGDKKKLDAILKSQSRYKLYNRVKYYPVLWDKPDIFHLQWAKGINEWIWVREFGIKFIVSLRGAHINYSPLANNKLAETYKLLFPKVDHFHAVSKAIAEEAEKYGANAKKIDVIYSGLDVVSSTSKHSETSYSNIKLISVGRSHWKKGYQYALDACKLLKDEGLHFTYTIVGVLKDVELLYQIEDLGLQSNVNLIGPIDYSEVEDYISKADVLILPSVEEGIANVVLEAMASDTLVITTDCGGMPEVIADNQNGFIVPVRNPEAIALAVKQIIKLSNTDLEIIKKAAKRTIVSQHSKQTMINGMVDMYNSTLIKL
ncbi:glycosyltransferase family 4 protein [Ichthyenterobacterium sp. W332]|uniref:Glycosyltransferase family 4 protein n=1 Tax=Microcosmobacter mediterraneus TaxID=3075607 RepID=A0ABU2YGT9_9FLAO|nr:glycosyltransferase family 4 protein [Ichthyenterobacterium sp. W332]MDT0557356.1 glycosyltransferase family 4 protein [Ichthyenterobacterium sp. W332]